MDIRQHFEAWRATKGSNGSWGLAWFLAYQFVRRYYASHGIAPTVIEKEGLGYYGICLAQVRCAVSAGVADSPAELGRLTIAGDVENWRIIGDDRLRTTDLCAAGENTESLVVQAIKHMCIPVAPATSHYNCRHKRWGSSWELCFEIATHLSFRHDVREMSILNAPHHVDSYLRKSDPKWEMKEHPGAFLFQCDQRSLLLCGDGRLLDGSGRNFWTEYMEGASAWTLALRLERELITGSSV